MFRITKSTIQHSVHRKTLNVHTALFFSFFRFGVQAFTDSTHLGKQNRKSGGRCTAKYHRLGVEPAGRQQSVHVPPAQPTDLSGVPSFYLLPLIKLHLDFVLGIHAS